MPPPPDIILFDDGDLRATLVAGRSRALLFVTFSSFDKNATLDRPGFGEDFLRDEGVAAIHVVARLNRWFQHAGLPALLAAIRAVAHGYERVVTYGSSMGGFAALTYGAECGANVGVAFSPQVSIDARAAPFETRWRREARAIRRWRSPAGRLDAQVIAYDPHHVIDAQHFAAFAARAPTIALRVPHGGHPVGAALSYADLLKTLARDAAAGTIDPARYERLLRSNRVSSPQYLYTVSRRLGAHHAARLALAERALALDASPHNRTLVATILAEHGRDGQAEAMHVAASAGGDVDAVTAHALFLAARGRAGEAAALLPATAEWRGLRLRLRIAGLLGIRHSLF